MERVALTVEKREGTGKSVTRKLRAQGQVPAVFYGPGIESTALTVNRLEVERILSSGSNRLIDLSGPPEVQGKLALIKDHLADPLSRALMHCDFYAVDTSKALHVSVPLVLEGKPHGVELGGVLDQVIREVEVSCLPLSIPDSLRADVSALEVGGSLHLRDLALPEGVSLLDDADLTFAHVLSPRVESASAAGGAEGESSGDAEAGAAAAAQ